MITLPGKTTDAGLESRVLLAECRGPASSGYSSADAKTCMQLMDAVLWNRVANPGPFLAKDGTLTSVVKARGQFAGFDHYPSYDSGIRKRIQDMLDIANSTRDKRSAAFADHCNAAIGIANAVNFTDPSPGKLVSWRTGGASSPGAAFVFFKTVLGIDFYYQP
jgi:hypothetical protein